MLSNPDDLYDLKESKAHLILSGITIKFYSLWYWCQIGASIHSLIIPVTPSWVDNFSFLPMKLGKSVLIRQLSVFSSVLE